MAADEIAPDEEQSTRKAILAMLKDGMDDLSADIADASPETSEQETLQLRRYHELGYLANQYRKLMKDTDIDEMEDDLALLKEAANVRDER